MFCRDADRAKEPRVFGGKVLLCIMSLSRSAVMKCLPVRHSTRCLSKLFLTSHRLFLASATAADYATLCSQEGGGMEKSTRRRVCVGGVGVCAGARPRQAGSEAPYRCLSFCRLHSSFPSFLTHPLSLHSQGLGKDDAD